MTRLIWCAMSLSSLVLLSAAPTARGAESYDNCTNFITSIPTTINASGTWCLSQNLSTSMSSGTAIIVSADNVTLDCNDFKIDGLAAGAGTVATGVGSSGNFNNDTVRHCDIRGFNLGLALSGSGHVVEDNRFDGNTQLAIDVEGDGSVVRRNRVFDTGGSSNSTDGRGISTFFSVDIIDNTISGVTATSGSNGAAIGIRTSNNVSGSIRGNRIRGLVKAGNGQAFGILNFSSDRLAIRNNDLVGDASVGSQGLTCSNGNGRARDNVISGFATALSGCINSVGNVIKP
jgi:hypothetical protein